MRAGGSVQGIGIGKRPRAKVKLYTRRQLHAAAKAARRQLREDAQQEKRAQRELARGARKVDAALRGCADQ